MLQVLIREINPEPWRAPKLSTKRIGKKVVPVAFADENTKAYQAALKELTAEALESLNFTLPVYPAHSHLVVSFSFWRQLERYDLNAGGRINVRAQPDVSNMTKATEDALQGVIYKNDKHNVVVEGTLVDAGPEVEPMVLIHVEEVATSFLLNKANAARHVERNGLVAPSGNVWVSS